MGVVSDGDTSENIQDLNDLMIRETIDRKRGPIEGEIFEIVSLRGQQMHDAQIKFEE